MSNSTKSEHIYLIVFKGLPGCGKTTLSRALGQSLGWPVVNKDEFSTLLDERIANYGALAHELMWRVARSLLEQGFSTICDSTLIRADNYADARRVAGDTGARLLVIECYCSNQILWRQRIEARKGMPTRYLSDWVAFQEYAEDVRLITSYPIDPPPWVVDTAQQLQDILLRLTEQFATQK